MEITSYTAEELFNALTSREDFLLLDVRNEEEFGRFNVEGPFAFDMINVPYFEFMEFEEESVAKVPKGRKLRIVCAKEGSAKYVAEILSNHGYEEVYYLAGGIKTWGNLLVPTTVNGNENYELVQFRRPGKASLSYGLIAKSEMVVFDPAKNIASYQTYAQQRGCTITRTFETHRQADYISGSNRLRKENGAEIIAPQPDFDVARFPYTPAMDGEVYTFMGAGPKIKAIHTPGHTPGSTSYLIDDKYLISGDTVFIRSIGRPDLGGMAEEWSGMLFKTMTEKILRWDTSMNILPGHYMDWEESNDELAFAAPLEDIIKTNGDIYGITEESDFFKFIEANMRTQPEEYAKIREINAGLVEADEEEQDVMDLGKNECAASEKVA